MSHHSTQQSPWLKKGQQNGTSKSKINGKALVWHSGSPGGVGANWFFWLFGTNASRVNVCLKRGTDSINMFVCIKQVFVTDVTEALMPQQPFCLSTNGIDWSSGVQYQILEGHLMIFDWDRAKGSLEVGLLRLLMHISVEDSSVVNQCFKNRVLSIVCFSLRSEWRNQVASAGFVML